jgi:hypothetical protein
MVVVEVVRVAAGDGDRAVEVGAVVVGGQGRNAGALLLALTTNLGRECVNPALLRPGRCAAHVELRPFSALEASGFLGRPHTTDATLAELLEARGAITQIADPAVLTATGQYL